MIVQPHDDKDFIFADYIHNCNDVNLCGSEIDHGFMKKCFPNHILLYKNALKKRAHNMFSTHKINREKWFILFIENRFHKISDTILLN